MADMSEGAKQGFHRLYWFLGIAVAVFGSAVSSLWLKATANEVSLARVTTAQGALTKQLDSIDQKLDYLIRLDLEEGRRR